MFEEVFQFAPHPPMPASPGSGPPLSFVCGFWGNHYLQNLVSRNKSLSQSRKPPPLPRYQRARPAQGSEAGQGGAAQVRLPGSLSRAHVPRGPPNFPPPSATGQTPLAGHHLLLALLRCREWSAAETRDASPGYTCPPA